MGQTLFRYNTVVLTRWLVTCSHLLHLWLWLVSFSFRFFFLRSFFAISSHTAEKTSKAIIERNSPAQTFCLDAYLARPTGLDPEERLESEAPTGAIEMTQNI